MYQRVLLTAAVLFSLSSSSALAATIETVELPTPFELATVESLTEPNVRVGELSGFPHTFEFSLSEATEVFLEVWVPASAPEAERVSLIAVEEIERGVREVMRRPASNDWEKFTDPVSGLAFERGVRYEETLAAGTYRVEVSNAENAGQYVLTLGEPTADLGYLETISVAQGIRTGLGYSPFSILGHPNILVPLFALLSFGFFGWWFWRRKR